MKCVWIDPVATGENLKKLIGLRDKKVKDVQEALGFETPQAVYMWLHGDRVPTIHNLVMLADFLDVMVDDIIITKHAGKGGV